jgi:hypothetical protein
MYSSTVCVQTALTLSGIPQDFLLTNMDTAVPTQHTMLCCILLPSSDPVHTKYVARNTFLCFFASVLKIYTSMHT